MLWSVFPINFTPHFLNSFTHEHGGKEKNKVCSWKEYGKERTGKRDRFLFLPIIREERLPQFLDTERGAISNFISSSQNSGGKRQTEKKHVILPYLKERTSQPVLSEKKLLFLTSRSRRRETYGCKCITRERGCRRMLVSRSLVALVQRRGGTGGLNGTITG